VITILPDNPTIGEEITFSAESSYDPNGSIVEYLWKFGDGYSAKDMIVKHTYWHQGEYSVTLKVIDNNGYSASTTKVIKITAEEEEDVEPKKPCLISISYNNPSGNILLPAIILLLYFLSSSLLFKTKRMIKHVTC
jgi:PKD repeat protein